MLPSSLLSIVCRLTATTTTKKSMVYIREIKMAVFQVHMKQNIFLTEYLTLTGEYEFIFDEKYEIVIVSPLFS